MVTAKEDERVNAMSCDGCRHYLGGGCCRINLEGECAAGGFEAWEPKEDEHDNEQRD